MRSDVRNIRDMQAVLTAIVGFIFVCVVLPDLVRSRGQWYAGLGCVIAAIFLDMLGVLFGAEAGGAFYTFIYVMTSLLVIASILLLVFACGGVTSRGIAGDFQEAIRVVRRSGEREVIVPGSGQYRDEPDEDAPPRHDLDAGELEGVDLRKKAPPREEGPLPLD